MSSRYEREIEEILRKTDESRPSVGERIRAMNQRPPTKQRSPRITVTTETILFAGMLLAFIAATLRWIVQDGNTVTNLITGVLALAAFALIAITLILTWTRGNSPQVVWRGQNLNGSPQGGQRRNPFSSLLIRVNLLKLRLNYRQRQH